MRRVRRPNIAGHLVAFAMVAVLLRFVARNQHGHFGVAHQHMGLARAWVQVDQLPSIEIGQVASVR